MIYNKIIKNSIIQLIMILKINNFKMIKILLTNMINLIVKFNNKIINLVMIKLNNKIINIIISLQMINLIV